MIPRMSLDVLEYDYTLQWRLQLHGLYSVESVFDAFYLYRKWCKIRLVEVDCAL